MGYAVWTTCPKKWSDPIVQHNCQNENQSDFLNNLPVFDNDSRITYRNIFCARCNGAVNTRYWKLLAICWRWFNTKGLTFEDLMRMVDAKCDVTISASSLQYLKGCIPRFQDCSRVSQERNDMNCQSQCLGYAFPVEAWKNGKLMLFRNVQCALCNGIKPMHLSILSPTRIPFHATPLPLSILFDFTSSSESSIEIMDSKMKAPRYVQQSWSCDPDEVYDPYTGKCKKIDGLNSTALVAKQHCIKPAATSLQIMTSAGCIASMVSLILLLTTYTFFSELRNLPGRIIINLSVSLLFYQGVFLGAVKTVSYERCKIIAVLLHFFVLCSFTWMNVMAYDVHKTFTSSGKLQTGYRMVRCR